MKQYKNNKIDAVASQHDINKDLAVIHYQNASWSIPMVIIINSSDWELMQTTIW